MPSRRRQRPSGKNGGSRCASSPGAPLVEQGAADVGDQHLDEHSDAWEDGPDAAGPTRDLDADVPEAASGDAEPPITAMTLPAAGPHTAAAVVDTDAQWYADAATARDSTAADTSTDLGHELADDLGGSGFDADGAGR